jgi:hypothetical protein
MPFDEVLLWEYDSPRVFVLDWLNEDPTETDHAVLTSVEYFLTA